MSKQCSASKVRVFMDRHHGVWMSAPLIGQACGIMHNTVNKNLFTLKAMGLDIESRFVVGHDGSIKRYKEHRLVSKLSHEQASQPIVWVNY